MTSWLFPRLYPADRGTPGARASSGRRPRTSLQHLGLRREPVPRMTEGRLEDQRVALGDLRRLGRRGSLEVQVSRIGDTLAVGPDDPHLRRAEDVPRREQLKAQRAELEGPVVGHREARRQRTEPVRHEAQRRACGDDPLVPGDVVRVRVAHEGQRRLPVRIQPERRARQMETSAPKLDWHDVVGALAENRRGRLDCAGGERTPVVHRSKVADRRHARPGRPTHTAGC